MYDRRQRNGGYWHAERWDHTGLHGRVTHSRDVGDLLTIFSDVYLGARSGVSRVCV